MPEIARLASPWLSHSREQRSTTESHRSPLHGFSTEFARHRQYAPGCAPRNLDWRVYGRTDCYYTKLYEAETNFDCYLLIDASSSMTHTSGKVSKLEYATFLAASMAKKANACHCIAN